MPAAEQRVGRWGDGYIHEGPPSEAAEPYRRAEQSWKVAGRQGRPRFVGAFYFGLGPNPAEKASATLADYYRLTLKPMPKQASASPSRSRRIEGASGGGDHRLPANDASRRATGAAGMSGRRLGRGHRLPGDCPGTVRSPGRSSARCLRVVATPRPLPDAPMLASSSARVHDTRHRIQ